MFLRQYWLSECFSNPLYMCHTHVTCVHTYVHPEYGSQFPLRCLTSQAQPRFQPATPQSEPRSPSLTNYKGSKPQKKKKKSRLSLIFPPQISILCSAGAAIEVMAIMVIGLITPVAQSAAISPPTDPVTPGRGGPDAASTRRTLLMISDVAAGMELHQTPTPRSGGGGRRRGRGVLD